MSLGCSLSGRNIRLTGALVSKQNRAVARSKKSRLLTRRGDSDGAGMGPESPVVEFRKFTNASPNARTDGQGPQDAPLAKLNISVLSSSLEVVNVLLRGSRKEKKLVKIALARQLCFTRWQIHVLGQRTGREIAQRHNGYAGFGGEGLQSFRGRGLLLGDRQTSEAAQPHGRRVARPG
jgi:hypothetical protein